MFNSATNEGCAHDIFLRFKTGDPGALGYYFIRYHSSLLTSTIQFLDNKQAAEDIVSELFVSLYERRNEIKNERHLLGYLYHTNKSKCLDYLRHKKNREKAETSFDLAERYAYIDVGEIEQARSSLYEELSIAIEQLSPLKKKVVLLYFFEKKKTQFIASHLRLAEQTVRNQLSKAKMLVKKSLDQRSRASCLYRKAPLH